MKTALNIVFFSLFAKLGYSIGQVIGKPIGKVFGYTIVAGVFLVKTFLVELEAVIASMYIAVRSRVS